MIRHVKTLEMRVLEDGGTNKIKGLTDTMNTKTQNEISQIIDR